VAGERLAQPPAFGCARARHPGASDRRSSGFRTRTTASCTSPNCACITPINRVASVVRRPWSIVEPPVIRTARTWAGALSSSGGWSVARKARRCARRNSATPEPLAECLDLIVERLGANCHSLWFNSKLRARQHQPRTRVHPLAGTCGRDRRIRRARVHYPPAPFDRAISTSRRASSSTCAPTFAGRAVASSNAAWAPSGSPYWRALRTALNEASRLPARLDLGCGTRGRRARPPRISRSRPRRAQRSPPRATPTW